MIWNSRWLAPCLLLLMGATAAPSGPRYTPAGQLLRPTDYREWVYLGTGLDMSYTEGGAPPSTSTFDNVFVDPAAWKAFQKTGHWPDKAMFVLEARAAASKGSINKSGQYETEKLTGVEFHVRDDKRFKGGWAFFRPKTDTVADLIPYDAQCYTCHQDHGAVDTTFTQFYPTAKPIAVRTGTYREPKAE